MRWTFARASKSPLWNLAKRLARWTPFAVSFAIVYLIASAFGIAPAMTNCPTEPVKTVSLLNTNFEVGVGDCFYSPFDAESHVVVYASRRGDWFGTRIFEYKGEAAPELEIVDDRTVRIAVLPRVSGTAREVNVFDIYAQRREWRGVNFDYELRNTQEHSK